MNLRDAQGIGEILLVGKHEENGITQFILLKLEGREEERKRGREEGRRKKRGEEEEEKGRKRVGRKKRGRRKMRAECPKQQS